jgi:DedD protein
MAWFNFGNNNARAQAKASVQAPAGSVEAMRQQAKFRLIGSVVLVLIAVVGLPILFDSQPRPVPIDIPIEIPDKTKVKPLSLPATPSQPAAAAKVDDSASLSGQEEIVSNSPAAANNTQKPPKTPADTAQAATNTVAKQLAEKTAADKAQKAAELAKAKAAALEAAQAKAGEKADAEQAASDKAAEKLAKAKEDAAKLAAEKADKAAKDKQAAADKAAKDKEAKEAKDKEAAARAQALLEGKPASANPSDALPDTGRFIVQFGAFSDVTKSREVRQKVERAGLKTYAQIAKTADGDRIRVRVGPFATKAEAEKAASKIKALDLPASILAL